MTLLDKAKRSPYTDSSNGTPEEIALVIAFYNGEITARQLADALDLAPVSAVYRAARITRRAITEKRISIKTL